MTEPGYRWLSEVLDIVDGATVEAGAIFDDQWQRDAHHDHQRVRSDRVLAHGRGKCNCCGD